MAFSNINITMHGHISAIYNNNSYYTVQIKQKAFTLSNGGKDRARTTFFYYCNFDATKYHWVGKLKYKDFVVLTCTPFNFKEFPEFKEGQERAIKIRCRGYSIQKIDVEQLAENSEEETIEPQEPTVETTQDDLF